MGIALPFRTVHASIKPDETVVDGHKKDGEFIALTIGLSVTAIIILIAGIVTAVILCHKRRDYVRIIENSNKVSHMREKQDLVVDGW